MRNIPSQIYIAVICLLVGIMAATQFLSLRSASEGSRLDGDQASYISRLYESNLELQQQADALTKELSKYQRQGGSIDTSNTGDMAFDLQSLRMANGEVAAVGPGVTLLADGDLEAFQLQDLVNELRNASAEAIAVNGVRMVARSAISADETGQITVDRQPLSRPYRLEAIGEPDTLAHAVQRKGGLIALLEARNPSLKIEVSKHGLQDKANWLVLPKTALDLTSVYGQPAP